MSSADMSRTLAGSANADELVERLRELGAVRRLLVAIDFDGTLAPLVADPSAARMSPAALDAILGLAGTPNTRVAIVSGRSLASLERVVDVPGIILLVGSHGVEYRLDHPEETDQVSAEELEHARALEAALDAAIFGLEDVWVEAKPVGVSVHTRRATLDAAEEAYRRAREAVAALGIPVRERDGKRVLEFALRSATKGDAIERLREYTNASAVFYAGDDVTDEDAFAALRPGDLGIKCGEGETGAEFRVADIDEMTEVIRLLAALRVG